MAKLLLENLDFTLLAQLEGLATLHGRSLQEEVQHLLQQAVQNQLRSRSTAGTMETARQAILRSQQRYAGRTLSDSADLIREDRDRCYCRI
jgi:antitoxin FitA